MNHSLSHRLYHSFARIGKTVSNGHRIAILDHLARGEHSVEALSSLTGISIANTSQHLQQLRQSGMVMSRKSGQHVFYCLSNETKIKTLIELIQSLAVENLAETRGIIKDLPEYSDHPGPINPAERLTATGVSERPGRQHQAA